MAEFALKNNHSLIHDHIIECNVFSLSLSLSNCSFGVKQQSFNHSITNTYRNSSSVTSGNILSAPVIIKEID